MLVAGEASGDLHGAPLCRALAGVAPDHALIGLGGARMAREGMEVVADVTASAAVGGSEALGRVPRLWRAFRQLRAILTGPEPPRALVLVDFPEFNLRLARVARKAGVPVIYFVPPQIWAWRGRRIRSIRRRISLVLAVFPFESPLYRRAGVPVEFVGHPLLDALVAAPARSAARRALGLDERVPVIGLLPGSRREEVARMLPVMRAAAARIAAEHPQARFLLGLAPTVERSAVAAPPGAVPVEILADQAHAVMRAADVLLVTSGTATLEAALLGTPMVVCYQLSAVSAAMARLLVRVPWFSLPNLTLGWQVVPELYEGATMVDDLTREALRLLGDPAARRAQQAAFADLAGQLGDPGVAARAARLVAAVAAGCR
jgi:lipid-A-disaccharide synthase